MALPADQNTGSVEIQRLRPLARSSVRPSQRAVDAARTGVHDPKNDALLSDSEEQHGAELPDPEREVEQSRTFRKPTPCRVLIVEDDPEHQWKLARTLTIRGNRVVGTSSGGGAMALISQWKVDLVLIDESLPELSGLELAKRIRDMHPAVHVVLMSTGEDAELENQLREESRKMGLQGCISKPLPSEALTRLTEEARTRPLRDCA